jgi:hypothetical protein
MKGATARRNKPVRTTSRGAGCRLGILDAASGAQVEQCTGPAPDGSCPRVVIGEVIPCAGHLLIRADAAGGLSYEVSAQMTLCPLTLAASLAVANDNALLPTAPQVATAWV